MSMDDRVRVRQIARQDAENLLAELGISADEIKARLDEAENGDGPAVVAAIMEESPSEAARVEAVVEVCLRFGEALSVAAWHAQDAHGKTGWEFDACARATVVIAASAFVHDYLSAASRP